MRRKRDEEKAVTGLTARARAGQDGGMKAEEATRLKKLEEENQRLKRLLAEAELDKAILPETLEGD